MPVSSKTMVNLSSGYQMPAIGLGTSFSTTSLPPDQAEVEATVKTALQIGYRHIDCAAVYQNESAVGRGIKASGIPREDIFITSKLWNTEHDPIDVGPALDQTLKSLDTAYVDLYLMHWPDAWVKPDPFTFFPKDENGDWITKSVPIGSTWAAMEKLVMAGKARSIGVSNFSQSQLEELISTAKIIPAVNQVEAHPYRSKKELLTWCSSKDIHITAWGPLTTNRAENLNVMSDPALLEISQSINITQVQLALSWGIQRGTSVIPKSSKEERLRSNFEIVELPSEIMEQVERLG